MRTPIPGIQLSTGFVFHSINPPCHTHFTSQHRLFNGALTPSPLESKLLFLQRPKSLRVKSQPKMNLDYSAIGRWTGGSVVQLTGISVTLAALDLTSPFINPWLTQLIAIAFFGTMAIRSRIFSVTMLLIVVSYSLLWFGVLTEFSAKTASYLRPPSKEGRVQRLEGCKGCRQTCYGRQKAFM